MSVSISSWTTSIRCQGETSEGRGARFDSTNRRLPIGNEQELALYESIDTWGTHLEGF